MPFSITGIGASGVTASKTTYAVPPSVSALVRPSSSPIPETTRSVTIRIFLWPKPQSACPSRRLAPGPTSSIGCGIGSSPVTTPAARIAVDSPTERTTSPTMLGISIIFVSTLSDFDTRQLAPNRPGRTSGSPGTFAACLILRRIAVDSGAGVPSYNLRHGQGVRGGGGMKTVVGISLGAGDQDFAFSARFLGQQLDVRRLGTNGSTARP